MNGRSILAISSGNILEWFDFALFLYLAPTIGKLFFPADDTFYSTLAAFGVLAAGFVCRPLGGILFGHIGDRIGRIKALTWSILAISSATVLVGLLPSYAQIGWTASGLFLFLRLLHGLSVGGEYTGAVIYLAEMAPAKTRGFLTSFAFIGANLGFLLATLAVMLLNIFLQQTNIDNWGWRLTFILSGSLGCFILSKRLQLQETLVFVNLQTTQSVQSRPLLTALQRNPGKFLQILGLTCMGSTFYYMFFGYMTYYLMRYYKVAPVKSLSCQAIVLLVMIGLLPIGGICGDYFGRKTMLLIAAIGIILFTLPCFYLLQYDTFIAALIGLSIAAILSALEQSNNLTIFVDNCPPETRYSTIAFSYNVGNAIFGGSAPVIFSILTEKINLLAAGYYLMIMAVISLITILTMNTYAVPRLARGS